MILIAFIVAGPAAPFTCTVTRVHDGDGPLWCSNGLKVRVAGFQAPDFENTAPCRAGRAGYTCSNVAADRSRRIVEHLTLHRTLRCQVTGKSYARVVARCTLPDGRWLSCAVLAAGAAVRWESYWRGMEWASAGKAVFNAPSWDAHGSLSGRGTAVANVPTGSGFACLGTP